MVVTDKERAESSYKCRQAVKLKIPVVSTDFITDSVNKASLQDSDNYTLVGETKKASFGAGKIVCKFSQIM